jgi:hypothetical protein
MKRLILVLFFFFMLTGRSYAQSSKHNIDQIQESGLTGEQAKRVLIVVLKHEGYHLNKRGMGIDGPHKINPTYPADRVFWSFGLLYGRPKAGSIDTLGSYAVSRFTGDVWETLFTCKHFDFPELKQIQTQIMQKTQKSFADETEARRDLGCTDE